MKKSELIDIYYFLFDVVDDIDMFTDLIKEKTDTKLTKAKIKSNLEYLNLNKLDSELNIIYDMKMEDLKKYFYCDTLLRKQGKLYFCRLIKEIDYEEINE